MSPISASIIEDFLHSKISASEAATKIATQGPDGELRDQPYEVWPPVLDAAQRRPDTQDRLIQLMSAIKQLPDQYKDGEPVIIHGMRVWADLPYFGFYMRDLWNCESPHRKVFHRFVNFQ